MQVVAAEDWAGWRALRLAALAEAPDAFSSTLADWTGAGDTEERWRARLSGVPFNVVASFDGQPAGMVSGTLPDGSGAAELLSTWVSPAARGHAVGDALVEAVIGWASDQMAGRLRLGVREANEHAIALYRRHGFIDCGPYLDGHGQSPPEREMVRHLDAS